MAVSTDLAIHGGSPVVPVELKRRWPEILPEDKAAVMAVLDRGILSGVYAPESTALEAEWAEYVGSKHALSFNSGTAALHAALAAAEIGPGDEVITTAFSFSASFHSILHQQAVPVFVDIDPRTYNIDVAQIEAKISPRTRAIMPVHIHGLPCDMEAIMDLANRYGLNVIEDACQAHGATYHERMAGTIGMSGTFSLNATKNFSGGEGGLLVTDDDEVVARASRLRTFGEENTPKQAKIRPYTVYSVGWNYRTQEMPAAFARSQLKRLTVYNQSAQRNAEYLTNHLSTIPGLIPPYIPDDRTSIYHKYRVRFDLDALNLSVPQTEFRGHLLSALEAEGVSVTLWHLDPLPSFPIFHSTDGTDSNAGDGSRAGVVDPDGYPQAQKLLDSSIIICDETYPIYNQPLELMEAYVEAIRKVMADPERLLRA